MLTDLDLPTNGNRHFQRVLTGIARVQGKLATSLRGFEVELKLQMAMRSLLDQIPLI
jgi:hypothetical protein